MVENTSENKILEKLNPMELDNGLIWIDKTFTRKEWLKFKEQISKNQEAVDLLYQFLKSDIEEFSDIAREILNESNIVK